MSTARLLCLFATALVAVCPGAVVAAGQEVVSGGEEAVVAPLPLTVPDRVWRPLRDRVDPALQKALRERLLAVPLWSKLVDSRCLAVGLVDISDIARPRYAGLNGDEMMYAASLPKIALLLAATHALEEGRLEESPELRQDLVDMIRVSSNAAATRTFERLGPEYIAKVLRDPRWGLYERKRGGLWVGKPYAKKGPRRGDPVHGIIHAATVTQTCRFYYLLATGRLINPERSREMLDVLADPGIHHKFVRSLDYLSPRARLFRKSGSWRVWHSDSVLVWGPKWRRYILVALVQHEQGEAIVQQLVPAVEEVLRR